MDSSSNVSALLCQSLICIPLNIQILQQKEGDGSFPPTFLTYTPGESP